jgi:plastocyanin
MSTRIPSVPAAPRLRADLMTPVAHERKAALVAAALCAAVAIPVASSSAASQTTKKPRVITRAVSVADDYFAPTKLTIKKGNRINFVWKKTNYDTHNVTLRKSPRGVRHSKFTSINAVSGIHFKRTFTTSGTYHFICTIHPSAMNLTVIVKK